MNADVANTCFYQEMPLSDAVIQMAHPTRAEQIVQAIQPKSNQIGGRIGDTGCYMQLKKLTKLRFKITYAGASEVMKRKVFQVKKIAYTRPRDTVFRIRDKKSGREWDTNVADYFMDTYGITIAHPYLPCVETMKGAHYPPEFCMLLPAQRYPFKLSEEQTTTMIKFAVTRPQERARGIADGLNAIGWGNDEMLARYGMKISPSMTKTNARLLQPPMVEFAQGRIENPGTAGRWRIDGKKFIQPNKAKLRKWAWVILNDWGRDHVSKDQVRRFMNEFGKFASPFCRLVLTIGTSRSLQHIRGQCRFPGPAGNHRRRPNEGSSGNSGECVQQDPPDGQQE